MNALELFSLKNRVAVVLGGTSGIGLAIARGSSEAGTIDVQDRASLQRLCDEVVAAYGEVDILMVTSGATKRMPTADMPEEEWNKVIDINLSGTFRANQIFGRQMLKQQRGSI